jgi:hypothetical protein
MSFTDSLTQDQKNQILEEVKISKSREIYRLCINLGIDPDTFVPEDYASPSPVMQHETVLLEQACKAYVSVLAKLG